MQKFDRFTALHRAGDPLVLFNAWDAGSARAVAEAGAPAIATGSWSVAAANGYADGEKLPLDLALEIAGRIARAVDLPVTFDFEGGYAVPPASVAANVVRLLETGVIGCNLEDRRVAEGGLYPVAEQAARIAAIRAAVGPAFFINARTDIFLQAPPADHVAGIEAAVDRAMAYAASGASGFFVPGLIDAALIGRICAASPLPVNVMQTEGLPPRAELSALGVARISHGPGPYRLAMAALKAAAAGHYAADGATP